ncbi:hypothetical protein JTE90_027500 [Oedothorax gibbosus]|uniref:Secreted protein n=1 Tax=Oedothorax gibbosus TaxID=931172 RepID=A0AAV6TDC1_9ARAC|nr:hypothetical protein JTE90_027500 [Oedothorax gibbosus]
MGCISPFVTFFFLLYPVLPLRLLRVAHIHVWAARSTVSVASAYGNVYAVSGTRLALDKGGLLEHRRASCFLIYTHMST